MPQRLTTMKSSFDSPEGPTLNVETTRHKQVTRALAAATAARRTATGHIRTYRHDQFNRAFNKHKHQRPHHPIYHQGKTATAQNERSKQRLLIRLRVHTADDQLFLLKHFYKQIKSWKRFFTGHAYGFYHLDGRSRSMFIYFLCCQSTANTQRYTFCSSLSSFLRLSPSLSLSLSLSFSLFL